MRKPDEEKKNSIILWTTEGLKSLRIVRELSVISLFARKRKRLDLAEEKDWGNGKGDEKNR